MQIYEGSSLSSYKPPKLAVRCQSSIIGRKTIAGDRVASLDSRAATTQKKLACLLVCYSPLAKSASARQKRPSLALSTR